MRRPRKTGAAIFDSRPYRGSRARGQPEALVHRRGLPGLPADGRSRRPAGRNSAGTLKDWQRADFNAIAAKMLAYLPPQATIRATIYPVIKPRTTASCGIWTRDPQSSASWIPAVTAAQFENTAAHELQPVGPAFIQPELSKTDGRRSSGSMRGMPRGHGPFGEGCRDAGGRRIRSMCTRCRKQPQDARAADRGQANFDATCAKVERVPRQIERETERGRRLTSSDGLLAFKGVCRRVPDGRRRRKRRAAPALLQCMRIRGDFLAEPGIRSRGGGQVSDRSLAGVKARNR